MNRIIFICRRFCPGEAWTNRLLAYAKGFAENGMNVVILFIISDNNRTPYEINISGVKIVNLWEQDGWLARLHRGFSYFINKARIREFIEDGDICFLTDASGNYINEIKKSAKKVKIVFESTEHPKILLKDDKKVATFLSKIKDVDGLFVISQSLKQYYLQNGISNDKIQVINMFVDTHRFDNIVKDQTRKYIAYCGNVSYDKDGVDVLIKSFSKFVHVHENYTLEIYGRSFRDSIERLKKLTDTLGVKDSVVFTGMVPFEEIPQKLSNASILALSRPNNLQNQNGFPTKLGEYLMTGNPVVVTSVGEIPLFVKNGVNGYLANPDSVDSFTDKLLQAVSDLDTGKNVGNEGRKLALAEFSYLSQTKVALNFINNLK